MAFDPAVITAELVACDTVSTRHSNTPANDIVQQRLESLGFAIERLDYTDERGLQKSNVIGKLGRGEGGLAYFGHSDVVPADDWSGPGQAFAPTTVADKLYGRGSCDMKGSVAAMLTAASRLSLSELTAPVYITVTADEEIGYRGAHEVAQRSQLFREMVAAQTRAIIGEPTRLAVVHAHKGTAGFTAISRGESAHSSSSRGKNANLAMIPFLQEMKKIHDELECSPKYQDERFDPPVMSWNIGVNDRTAAVNIKPPQSVCTVYFRPMPGQDPAALLARAEAAAAEHGLEFQPSMGSTPVYTDPDSPYVQELLSLTGQSASQTVCYGTDGGMLRELQQMVVLGPGDIAQAHTCDEWIELEQLSAGADLYERLMRHWCTG